MDQVSVEAGATEYLAGCDIFSFLRGQAWKVVEGVIDLLPIPRFALEQAQRGLKGLNRTTQSLFRRFWANDRTINAIDVPKLQIALTESTQSMLESGVIEMRFTADSQLWEPALIPR